MHGLVKIGSSKTLTEKAYLTIRNAIVNQQIKPNEILQEDELANILGISRTPIRAALNRLSYEKLIKVEPNRTARVADITIEEIEIISSIREALEPLAVKIAINNISESDLEQLKEIIDKQKATINKNDFDANSFLYLDYEFHIIIGKKTNNEILYDFISTANLHVQRYLILSHTLQQSASSAIDEHEDIYRALLNKDEGDAIYSMEEHLRHVRLRMLRL